MKFVEIFKNIYTHLQLICQVAFSEIKNLRKSTFYSIVIEYWFGCAVEYTTDTFFCFTTTIRRFILQMPHYTEYQYYPYETISKLREKGMAFNQIADHLNKKKVLNVSGKQFRDGHIHSIIKKK